MDIKTRPVEYFDGKQKCIGYLAWDDSVDSARPCVLIGHAWSGLDDFAQDKAIQMAAMGYVGFAIDVYGDGALPQDNEAKGQAMTAIKSDRSVLLTRVKAGMKAAAKLPEVDESAMAMMGFCFGGLCTLDLARSGAPLKAAISFHGFLDAPTLPAKNIKAKVLAAHGYDDPMVPSDQIIAFGDEMTKAGVDWQLLALGRTSHAFMVPSANDKKLGLLFNENSERRAWLAALGLLDEVFALHGVA
ncbi:MAG: dienelactone hydrolase family protein [Robiginitomaculum sp.]